MEFGYAPISTTNSPAGFEFTPVTEDVAAALDRAVNAGATPLAEPHDTAWGQTVPCVRDHVGTLIVIASPIGA